MILLPLVSILVVIVDSRVLQRNETVSENLTVGKHRRKFTVEELMSSNFPHSITGDLDLDVCKAGGFLGDIALPNVKYETEWRQQKLNKSYLEELEKYQEEVLKEGLQVEEEGLTEILQFKNEHDALRGNGNAEESVAAVGKTETITADRNQYSMNSDSTGAYNFGRDRDSNPEIKDTGIEFKVQDSTIDERKKHNRHHRLESSTSPSLRMKPIVVTEETTSYPPVSTPRTRHSGHQEMRFEFVTEATAASASLPETTTDPSLRRRARRHHRRRASRQ